MMRFVTAIALGVSLCAPLSTVDASQDISDMYPGSPLYSKPVEVIPHVWTAIGATAPPGTANAGHNNNLSFIVTGDGVVVINGGGCACLAEALHDEIKTITDQPVKLVINENGQGHAMLGNSYWAKLGIPILAHEDAYADFEEHGFQDLERMRGFNGELGASTEIAMPTETFTDKHVVEMGDFRIEVLYLGPSHSPGDTQVWLPDQSLVIAGDMAFHERLLPLFGDTLTAEWLETWDTAFEALNATYVIPGHGHPTNMAQVRRYTRDYLVHLRGKIREHLDAGRTLEDAYYVDQSPFEHLDTFEELATRNAGFVYVEMEFE